MENIKSVKITSFFMGSTYEAKYRNGKGEPYVIKGKKDKNVYLYKKISDKEDKYQFTFSGPNALDINFGTGLTIKLIHKKGVNILRDKINEFIDSYNCVKIEIKGHSRGATIAGRVWNDLKNIFKNNKKVEFVILGKFDEYSGPINRLNKKNDYYEVDKNDDSIIVYCLKSHLPFNSPTEVKNSKVYIFTDNTHGGSNIVGSVAMARRKKGDLPDGVYLHTEKVPHFHTKLTNTEMEKLCNFKKTTEFKSINKNNINEIMEYLKNFHMTNRRGILFVKTLNERYNLNLNFNKFTHKINKKKN